MRIKPEILCEAVLCENSLLQLEKGSIVPKDYTDEVSPHKCLSPLIVITILRGIRHELHSLS